MALSSSSSRATTRAVTMDDDGSIDGRDGRGRARGWVIDHERRGPSRWLTIDRWTIDRWRTIASIDRVDPRGRDRCARIDAIDASIGSPSSSSSANGAGGHEMWSVPIAGRRRLSGRRRRDARTGGGGRARGEWTNDAWRGVGRGRVRSGGGARRRVRERDAARDRGRAGRAKAGRVTDEGCFLNFCARV